MVIHFFELKMTHLSLHMIDAFFSYFKDREQGVCICCQKESELLFGTREEEEEKYRKTFVKNNIINYRFVNGENAIVSAVKEEVLNGNLCVLHGYYPLHLIYKSFGLRVNLLSKIVSVHWGGEEKINKNFRSFRWRLVFLRRCFCYSKFKCFVTLAESDKLILKNNYGINNIVLNPYIVSFDDAQKRYQLCERKIKNKIKVMVAHSGHTYNNHLEALFLLKEKYNSVIEEVSCPLCYGPKDYIDEVIKVGRELFGDRFYYFTDLLSREEYVKYIRSKDVYVTASPIQSGLFAASVALGNGLKVYCGQSNFDNFTSKDYKIYKFDDLAEKKENDFVTPLSCQEIKLNYEKLLDQERFMQIIKKWEEILFGKIKF